jgi:type I restriction enzyme S subunit
MEILLPQLRFPEFIGEWEEKKFDEIFLFSTGKNIKQNESSPEFETPCVRYGELYHMYNEVISAVINKTNLDRTELVFSQGNEILLPSAGEDPLDIGSASALTIKNVAIGRTINILRPLKMDIYSQIYASYFINEKLRKKISTLAKGVSISNVYNSDLKTLEIILPSLPEQTKIAAFLTVVDNKLTALKQKKTLLEQYKKGVMQQIFSQELRFKDDTSTSLSTGSGNDFADWEEKKLGELGDIVTGKTPSTTNLDLWDGEIQFVTPTDINDSKYQYTSVRTVKKTDKLKVLPPKSIMFTCIASIGKMSISLNPSITNQQINSIVAFEQYDNEFIYYSLLNITDYIKSTPSSSTLPLINKTEFSKFTIQLPCLKEQTKIANFLSSIDEKINHSQAQIEKATIWKKGLLQQLFV